MYLFTGPVGPFVGVWVIPSRPPARCPQRQGDSLEAGEYVDVEDLNRRNCGHAPVEAKQQRAASPGEFTKSQTFKKKNGSWFSLLFCWYSRDKPHESFRNTTQTLPQHCSHPSTTRIIHRNCVLCGLSEVEFRNDVTRSNVSGSGHPPRVVPSRPPVSGLWRRRTPLATKRTCRKMARADSLWSDEGMR